jgi:hypothetical protein
MKRHAVTCWLAILILAGLLVLIPLQSARADTGPKPTMNFSLIYEINPAPEISSGSLLECTDVKCADSEPLQQLGPQHFGCSAYSCSSMAYGYRDYHRLVLEFSDGVTRQSNVFTKTQFAAKYKVTVYADTMVVAEQIGGAAWPVFGNTVLDLLLGLCFFCLTTAILVILVVLLVKAGNPEATFTSLLGWLIASWVLAIPTLLVSLLLTRGLVTTLAVELLLGTFYVVWRKRPAVLVLTVILLLNLVTQPALWLTVRGFSGQYPVLVVLFAEMIVWLVEAVGLFLAQRKRIGFGEALLVSFVLNAASFGIGLLFPF